MTVLLVPEATVRAQLGLSRSTWWRMLRDGTAPPHVLLGTRRFYRPHDLEAWLAARTVHPAPRPGT